MMTLGSHEDELGWDDFSDEVTGTRPFGWFSRRLNIKNDPFKTYSVMCWPVVKNFYVAPVIFGYSVQRYSQSVREALSRQAKEKKL